MDNDKMVPYIVFEGEQVRHERTTKRLIVALILAVICIFVSNAMWLYEWSQYDYIGSNSETVTVDGKDGIANYIGNSGVINNGKDNSNTDTDQN